MAKNPSAVKYKISAISAGWAENAPGVTIAGLTEAQFKAKVKPSLDARNTIADLEVQLAAARVARDNADVITTETKSSIVNSVKGHPEFGENSALYASFGYVRKNDRKSGLKRAVPLPPQPALAPTVVLPAAA